MLFPDLFHKPSHFTPLHPRQVAHLAWATPENLPGMQAINAALKDPMSRADVAGLVHNPRTSAMVAERGGRIVGFAGYRLHDLRLELLHFATHPEYRNLGVGCQMFAALDAKLSLHNLPRMTIAVSELDGPTWGWFINRGMRGCGLRRDGIRPGVDAYIFEYWARDSMAIGAGNCPENCP
jgi:[ribosomal protein S18]-alanine N-acetyltransferase